MRSARRPASARTSRATAPLASACDLTRVRLDKLLVEHGLAPSRERAQALILAGKVLVNGQPATKAGSMIDPGAQITLKEDDHPWVSRGALKLIKALDDF